MKSLKLLLLALPIAALISSCATPHLGIYTLNMNDVECTKPTSPEVHLTTLTRSDGSVDYAFDDDNIHIVWTITNVSYNFTLENHSGSSIKIPWDEVTYVDQNGLSRKVIHEDTKYENKDNPQAVSVVAKNSKIVDYLIPSDNIVPENRNFSTWKTYHLFYDKQNNVGQQVCIVLPLLKGDERIEYSFLFKITDWKDNTPAKKGIAKFFEKLFGKK